MAINVFTEVRKLGVVEGLVFKTNEARRQGAKDELVHADNGQRKYLVSKLNFR